MVSRSPSYRGTLFVEESQTVLVRDSHQYHGDQTHHICHRRGEVGAGHHPPDLYTCVCVRERRVYSLQPLSVSLTQGLRAGLQDH